MFMPGSHSESATLVGYLEAQLVAIRASAYGLTEAQARETPCRSTLSIGGLVKHATYVMTGSERVGRPLDQSAFALFSGSFGLTDDESLESTLTAFDTARERYLTAVRATDPAAASVAPPAPWDGLFTPTASVERFALVHHVEEFARHAGHADIIREQLDGADASRLLMAVEGMPGNDFVQPWTPAG